MLNFVPGFSAGSVTPTILQPQVGGRFSQGNQIGRNAVIEGNAVEHAQSSLGTVAMTLIAGFTFAMSGYAKRRGRHAVGNKQRMHNSKRSQNMTLCSTKPDVITKIEEECRSDVVIQTAQECMLNNYGTRSIVATHGDGNYLFDAEGRKYLDFAAGIAVNCLGHCEPGWVDAVAKQAGTLVHTSNMFLSPPQVQLAERLVSLSFADKAFFANSGTEANEGAIKFARKFHLAQGKPREKLVAFENSFHGRTMGALSLTWKEKYRTPFQPLMPSVDFLPYNDISALEAIDETVCAVFIEPVQGEGGCIPGNPEFLAALRHRCDAVGALLVFDEVQAGLGRTGKLFAYEHSGVLPDIVTLAKPLAAGLPIGACLMSDKVGKVIEPGDHGSTFAGGPLVCAAANYTLDRLSDKAFLANVAAMGDRLREGLRSIVAPYGFEVRGTGLLNGVVCSSAAICSAIQSAARENGLIVLTAGAGDTLRIVPSLTITASEIDEGLAILKKAFDHVDIPYPSVVAS